MLPRKTERDFIFVIKDAVKLVFVFLHSREVFVLIVYLLNTLPGHCGPSE